jgi:hypothetical protein
MSSLVRRIERNILRRQGTWEGKPQPVVNTKDGGYRTLRPTKGWLKVSGKRAKLYKDMQS